MVGAGMLDQALAVYREMVKPKDPVERLNALYDLSRLEEQADHFENAAKALREGLALSHFKDWRYEEFFRRLVKLHEHYSQLDTLKAQLLKEARTEPKQEKALLDMVRFSDMVVDPDEQVRWLRELTQSFPAQIAHRWALVLLRCEVSLRTGDTDAAVARLQKLFDAQRGNPDAEKAVYQFATQHSLDSVIESVLRAR